MNSLVHRSFDNADFAGTDWNAELKLGFRASDRGTLLVRAEHKGPLYVQKPFYPEGRDLAHLYLLHPPGGLVSGDDLQISVDCGAESQALLTTPGAGRVYRARPDRKLQSQSIELNLECDSTLEWLPLETILFPDACTRLNTRVNLAPGARYIGWEVTSLGLPSQQQPFTDGSLDQTLEIFCDGRIKLLEKMQINDQTRSVLAARAGLNKLPVTGMMVAGPLHNAQQGQYQALNEQLQECVAGCGALAAVSLTGEFMVVRYLGTQSDQALQLFSDCWAIIRPHLIGRERCSPRIWAT